MSRRHPAARPPFRPPVRLDGSRACRWCWGPVAPPRRTWCGGACLAEYRLEHDWKHIVAHVTKRDRGVCAICGVDTFWLQNALRHLWSAAEDDPWWLERGLSSRHPHWRRIRVFAHRLGVEAWGQPFEVDHVVARADGGGNHPDNLRTLCIACHRKRTAAQASERAARRRSQRVQDQPQAS